MSFAFTRNRAPKFSKLIGILVTLTPWDIVDALVILFAHLSIQLISVEL